MQSRLHESPLVKDNVDHIMEVMETAFDPTWGEAWNRRQVSDALIMPSTHVIVISASGTIDPPSGGDIAGFCLSRHTAGEEELLLIGVKPTSRGAGLGRKMIKQLIRDAQARGATRIYLEMRANNPAESLYRTIGFQPIGKRPKYYRLSNGERMDAITFGLAI